MILGKNSPVTSNEEDEEDSNCLRISLGGTSVWSHECKLKKDALTIQNYIDLVKVTGLYVSDAGPFLRELRMKNQLRLKDIAELVEVTPTDVCAWEKNRKRMSLRVLVKIAENFDISRDKIYSMIENGEIKTKLPATLIRFDKIRDIVPFLLPCDGINPSVYLRKCKDETLKKVEETLNFKLAYRSKRINSNRAVIYSWLFHRYLKTFFSYSKFPKIIPPLTNEVETWSKKGLDLRYTVILPLLQTEGCITIKHPLICFWGNNRSLHDLFVDAMYFQYGLLPSSYYRYNKNSYVTDYTQKSEKAEKIQNELLTICGNTKTKSDYRQTVEEYLKEPQPHLNYLRKSTEAQIALRIWASAEGCISIHRHKTFVYPVLNISCAHPILVNQLKKISKKFQMHFNILRSKTKWSGFTGLGSTSIKNILNFLRIGGFIKRVEISSHSKYHKGIAKDILTLGILEFKKREKTSPHLRKLSIKKVHYEINKIVKNNEYNSADYYIEYFS